MLKRSLLLFLIFLPVTCWAFIKPARILAPEWNGLTCVTKDICVEGQVSFNEANELYVEALNYVNGRIGQIGSTPKASFCKTEECFRSFGFSSPAKAKTIGTYGIVIGPEGWRDYIVRHEFIHHLQSEKLGVLRQWLIEEWFKEGMAYSMSKDPRQLSEKWSDHRDTFERWYSTIEHKDLWVKAKRL